MDDNSQLQQGHVHLITTPTVALLFRHLHTTNHTVPAYPTRTRGVPGPPVILPHDIRHSVTKSLQRREGTPRHHLLAGRTVYWYIQYVGLFAVALLP